MKDLQCCRNQSVGTILGNLPRAFGALVCCLPLACGGGSGTDGGSYTESGNANSTSSTGTGTGTGADAGTGTDAGAAGPTAVGGVTNTSGSTTSANTGGSGAVGQGGSSTGGPVSGGGGATSGGAVDGSSEGSNTSANAAAGGASDGTATSSPETSTTGSTTVSGCGTQITLDPNPFGCEMAWGANGDQGNRSSYLQFITTWVGYEDNGGLNGDCDGCGLVQSLTGNSAIPVYYAYHIGYMTQEDGYGDCNTDFDNQNLCTHGAQWIRENRERLIDAYGNYAEMTYQANSQEPVVWLLEGDFIQYTYEEQTQSLSVQELSQLASDIICAIRSNAPNSVIAINHSPWISNDLTDEYYAALPMDLIDLIWTTGVGNNNGFINSSGSPSEYNGATARYDYLHELTGKRILVDTSFGASQMSDSWSGESQAELNQRIAEGVSAVNVTEPPGNYQERVNGLQLASTCQ